MYEKGGGTNSLWRTRGRAYLDSRGSSRIVFKGDVDTWGVCKDVELPDKYEKELERNSLTHPGKGNLVYIVPEEGTGTNEGKVFGKQGSFYLLTHLFM